MTDDKKYICLAVLGVSTLSVALGVLVYHMAAGNIPTYGEKQEEGIQVACGTITDAISVHGGDWTIWIENEPYAFKFPYGTFGLDNHPRVGENIAIAYEWRKLYHEDCVGPPYNRHYYWAPVNLAWEILEAV